MHLVDSFYCTQPTTFISAVLLTASSMMRLGLPHVNILSKVDLLSQYGKMPFNLEFFTEMDDLRPLAQYVNAEIVEEGKEEEFVDPKPESRLSKKFKKMTSELCDVLSDFGLISFYAVNIQDASTVGRALNAIDKANGFAFAATVAESYKQHDDPASSITNLFKMASQECEPTYFRTLDIQERYNPDSISGNLDVADHSMRTLSQQSDSGNKIHSDRDAPS